MMKYTITFVSNLINLANVVFTKTGRDAMMPLQARRYHHANKSDHICPAKAGAVAGTGTGRGFRGAGTGRK
jgi:hypothetical protein